VLIVGFTCHAAPFQPQAPWSLPGGDPFGRFRG